MIAKRSLVESERNINLKLDNYHNKFNTLSLKHRRVYYGENGHKYLLKNINLYNKQKGIVFIWPQRKKCRSNQEMTSFIWFFAQCLYYMHILNFWPNSGIGTVLLIEAPAWEFKTPLPKPDTKDYIIEPDWDSVNL